MVQGLVVVGAQQHPVLHGGGPFVFLPEPDVVDLAPGRWDPTAGGGAALVAGDDGLADPGREGSLGSSDVQRFTGTS